MGTVLASWTSKHLIIYKTPPAGKGGSHLHHSFEALYKPLFRLLFLGGLAFVLKDHYHAEGLCLFYLWTYGFVLSSTT